MYAHMNQGEKKTEVNSHHTHTQKKKKENLYAIRKEDSTLKGEGEKAPFAQNKRGLSSFSPPPPFFSVSEQSIITAL